MKKKKKNGNTYWPKDLRFSRSDLRYTNMNVELKRWQLTPRLLKYTEGA